MKGACAAPKEKERKKESYDSKVYYLQTRHKGCVTTNFPQLYKFSTQQISELYSAFLHLPGISQIGVEFPSDFSRKSCKPQACGGRVKQTVSLDEWVASSVSYVVLVVDELNRP